MLILKIKKIIKLFIFFMLFITNYNYDFNKQYIINTNNNYSL